MIIDSNVLYGFENQAHRDLSPERSLRLMEEKQIDVIVFSNLKCKYYDFEEGNRETYELTRKYPGKVLGYAGFHQSQYLLVEKDLERCHDEYHLAGVRFFNTMTGFMSGWGGGFSSLFMDVILKKLEGWKWPLFVEGGVPFDQIVAAADKYPELPIIASGVGYGNMGEAICAVRRCPNVFLEISTLDTMDGIRILTQEIGGDRIIFGTGMPLNAPTAERLMVQMADVSDETKADIFAGNFLRILQQGGGTLC